MKLIHRISYFSVGLFFGIILLIFFLGGKRASCDYTPNDRVLKNIRLKERTFSDEALVFFRENDVDTAYVSVILQEGNVDFGRSETKAEPCKSYLVEGQTDERDLELLIKNCDSLATIQTVRFAE